MRLNIHCQGFKLTEPIRLYVERRMRSATDTASNWTSAVEVHLTDINAETAAARSKRCRVVIALHRGHTLVAEAVNADLYTAIFEAAGRVRAAVWRHLKRRRTLRRQYAKRGCRHDRPPDPPLSFLKVFCDASSRGRA